MPTYPFVCDGCRSALEQDKQTRPTCPKCGEKMRRDWKAQSVAVQYHPTKGGK